MADLTRHFEVFHESIRVDTEPLVEKRDIILDRIRAYLREKGLPGFELVNQGSYIYNVGVVPLENQEYDIDVGLAFNILSADYADASTVRKWVLEAVKGHTKSVRDRGPCIRVHYSLGFHVDLVIYAKYKNNRETENFQMAYKDGTWKPSDPKSLKKYIETANSRFSDTKSNRTTGTQLNRVVRCLKRANDVAIPEDSEDKPSGISMLLLAIQKLAPTLNFDNTPNDPRALKDFCGRASLVIDRIRVNKPTPEYEDVFAKLDHDAMSEFLVRLKNLKAALEFAERESDTQRAAEAVALILGDDFPTTDAMLKSRALGINLEDERMAKIAALEKMAAEVTQPSQPWSED